MILANIEWIGALCTFLSLACAIQLIVTGIFAMCIPEVLLLTGSHLSTGAGLMSGFVALPTALRLKTAQMYPFSSLLYSGNVYNCFHVLNLDHLIWTEFMVIRYVINV